MNSITKTIRGLQRFASIIDIPYSLAESVGKIVRPCKLPKSFSIPPKPLAKGERRKGAR